ncbi:hypothetical protein ASG88_02145 [Nocardioides sp. Soil777]|uniref:hypothetical protein n=1 Tax=Nocardioides sp. Soil777 TaxID=1736409 RepID=UPI0007035BEB|nr:hypothetical protein [Nocardioides sp. Soil777]KRF07650.1 hypothetical protein ASG88_02145 [Nocardioides sp. Soil777]
MQHARARRHGRRLLLWQLVVAVGLVLTLLSDTALPLAFAALSVAVASHARELGWRLSFAVVLLYGLVAQVCFAWLAPHVGGSLATDNTVAWALFGVLHALWGASRPLPQPGTRQWATLAGAVVTPLALAAYFGWTAASGESPWLGWAMAGDAANNMILNREFVEQGGLLRAQGNTAPLATVVHASWAAPSLGDATQADTVRQLVLHGGLLGLGFLMLLGVAGSLLALRHGPRHPGRRVTVGAAAGLLPWMWCVAGFALAYGYQNSPPAMLILLLGWICWVAHREHPVASVTGLVLATWASAMAWGPVVLVPALWLVAAVVAERRALRRAGWLLVVPASALVGAASYALLVTLPDLRSSGGVPGVDGGHPNFDHRWVMGTVVGLSLLVLLLHRWIRPEVRCGYWVALPAAGLAAYQLIGTRTAADLPMWGYYPIKFTWIVMSVLVLILFSELHQPFSRVTRRLWRGGGVLLALAVPFALMFQVTPPLRPVTLANAFTPVRLHDDIGYDATYDTMFDLMAEEPRTIVSLYHGPEAVALDSLMNFWLLQSGATSIADPIRFPAYTMDSTDPVAVCSAITTWGGDMRVVTRSPRLERILARTCPTAPDYDVELVTGRARS